MEHFDPAITGAYSRVLVEAKGDRYTALTGFPVLTRIAAFVRQTNRTVIVHCELWQGAKCLGNKDIDIHIIDWELDYES